MVISAKEEPLIDETELESSRSLADRVRHGDRSAEGELVELFERRIFALVLARTLDPQAAEDLTQETLIAALEALREGKLRDPEKLAEFLRGTARNLCNNLLRSRSRQPRQVEIDTPSTEPSPEVQFRRRELLELAGRCLGELDELDQKIILWSLVDRLSSEEIGKRLGIRPETARQHKSRALQRVRMRSWTLSRNPRGDHKGSGGRK